jgi:hypothetical protein
MSEPYLDADADGVFVGRSAIYGTPFLLNLDCTINRNIAVLGMSGSGKSYFLKSMIIRSCIWRGSSVLIVDWNNEYRDVVRFLGGRVLKLGSELKINLFDLYDIGDTRHIRRITDIIGNSLNLNDAESYAVYEMVLQIASEGIYSGTSIATLIDRFSHSGGALGERLGKKLLQLKANPMFADATGFPVNSLLDGVTSIDFSMLKGDAQRGETSRAVLGIIVELMHSMSIDNVPRNQERMIVLDETWRLIRNSEEVGMLFREGRKYGFAIIVATQLAADISNEVLSNAASLFLFRLQNDSDYRLLAESGIISEQDKRRVTNLPVGGCMVSVALKEDNGAVTKFFIKRTDGIVVNDYTIRCDSMQRIVSHRLFSDSTKRLLVGNEAKERIVNFLADSNNEVDSTAFVGFLAGLGIERSEIFFYLRLLGLNDAEIVNALCSAAGPSFG